MVTNTTISPTDPSDAAILARVIGRVDSVLSAELANEILGWRFEENDQKRMAELAEKAREGDLSHLESSEIDGYIRVGNLLSFMHAKARATLEH